MCSSRARVVVTHSLATFLLHNETCMHADDAFLNYSFTIVYVCICYLVICVVWFLLSSFVLFLFATVCVRVCECCSHLCAHACMHMHTCAPYSFARAHAGCLGARFVRGDGWCATNTRTRVCTLFRSTHTARCVRVCVWLSDTHNGPRMHAGTHEHAYAACTSRTRHARQSLLHIAVYICAVGNSLSQRNPSAEYLVVRAHACIPYIIHIKYAECRVRIRCVGAKCAHKLQRQLNTTTPNTGRQASHHAKRGDS